MEFQTEKEFVIIMMVKDMKVIGEMVLKTEKENIILKMVLHMRVIGEMINKKEKEWLLEIMAWDTQAK